MYVCAVSTITTAYSKGLFLSLSLPFFRVIKSSPPKIKPIFLFSLSLSLSRSLSLSLSHMTTQPFFPSFTPANLLDDPLPNNFLIPAFDPCANPAAVSPSEFLISVLTPAANNAFTELAAFAMTAKCNAVHPSSSCALFFTALFADFR